MAGRSRVSIEDITESKVGPIDSSHKRRALARANRVRNARAQVKAQITAGELTAAEVILSARWEIERMPNREVLGSQPQWGAVRSCGFLAGLHIAETQNHRLDDHVNNSPRPWC